MPGRVAQLRFASRRVALCVAAAAAGVAPGRAARAQGRAARVTVEAFVVPRGPMPRAVHLTLLATLEQALKRDRRLSVKDKDQQLARLAGTDPGEEISEARGHLRAGEALLAKGNPAEALRRLSVAEKLLEKLLAHLPKGDLERAQFLLGAAQAMLGDEEAAAGTFVRLLVWRPDAAADTAFAPAQVLPLWEKARAEAGGRGTGGVEVTSEPEGALTYVDGHFAGFTPTAIDGLTLGDHYVTIKLDGYQRKVSKVRVADETPRVVREELEASPGADRVADALARAAPDLGRHRAAPAVTELAGLLGIDHALFLAVERGEGGGSQFEAYLYDLSRGRLLARAHGEAAAGDDVDAVLGDIVRSLYSGVRFGDEDPLADLTPPPARGRDAPFYKRTWFWVGVGAVAAGAIAVPLLMRDGGGGCPGDATCGSIVIEQ